MPDRVDVTALCGRWWLALGPVEVERRYLAEHVRFDPIGIIAYDANGREKERGGALDVRITRTHGFGVTVWWTPLYRLGMVLNDWFWRREEKRALANESSVN